jgi:hypothetical protein
MAQGDRASIISKLNQLADYLERFLPGLSRVDGKYDDNDPMVDFENDARAQLIRLDFREHRTVVQTVYTLVITLFEPRSVRGQKN